MDEMRPRGAIVKGVVRAVDDSGVAQTLTVETHPDIVRTGIEVMSTHGLASHVSEGAEVLLLAIEGDEGHYVALPPALFPTRFGGLPPGGAALYDDAGNRLVFPADGSGLLTVAGLLRLMGQTMRFEAPGGARFEHPVTFGAEVTFEGPVTFQGGVHMQGTATIDGDLHVGGAITGASVNGRP